jgi:predicted nucleic-acid-binding protein
MKALDTNVLVRFLVRDDEQQADAVYRRFKKAEADKEVLFVPLLVILETVWILESVYKVSRREIADSIGELLLMPILQFEAPAVLQGFMTSARETTVDLPDLLIAHSARRAGCKSVVTFDKGASKSEFFELLK